MASNRLVVNPTKTDVLWCSSSQPPPDTPLLASGTTVQPSASLRNLGILFDVDLSLAAHVNQLTAHCYSSLHRIKSCRRALTRSASVILVNSFIVSKLDYCNSLFAGCSKQLVDKLQRVLNCAAQVIFGGDRPDHITPLLRDKLHWLRARERITFKLCLLVYKAINGLAPSYLQDLCVPVTTVSTRSTLRSAARGDLVVPRTRRRLGNRTFCVAGNTAWNNLPSDIRTASSVTTFKNLLKTHLLARDSIYAIARSLLTPVRPSVPLSVCHTGGSVKDG